MLIIEAIRQHVQENDGVIPDWANYATQDDSTLEIRYWELKLNRFLKWGDKHTSDATENFFVSYLCEDWETPLKITDSVRNYVNQPEATVTDLSQVQNNTEISTIQKDNINPDHYKVGGIETIDYMKAKSTSEEFQGHLRLTAIKYLSRAGHKDNSLQEYKKAAWYLDYLIKEIEDAQ